MGRKKISKYVDGKTVTFRLPQNSDQDLLQWLNERHNVSNTIYEILKEYAKGNLVNKNEILMETYKDILDRFPFVHTEKPNDKSFISPVIQSENREIKQNEKIETRSNIDEISVDLKKQSINEKENSDTLNIENEKEISEETITDTNEESVDLNNQSTNEEKNIDTPSIENEKNISEETITKSIGSDEESTNEEESIKSKDIEINSDEVNKVNEDNNLNNPTPPKPKKRKKLRIRNNINTDFMKDK